jgi:hypothetical protein
MTGIFISYRREDSAGYAGRLADDLKESFAPDLVFMDVTSVAPGLDFRKVIEQKVSVCDVLLAVIGKSWLTCLSANGKPRLQDQHDFVHLELASALQRDIPVIPVLVDGATMPAAADLPPSLEALAWRNAVELRHAKWGADLQGLVTALRAMLPPSAQSADRETGQAAPTTDRSAAKPRLSWKLIGSLVAILAVAVLALMQLLPTRNGEHRPACITWRCVSACPARSRWTCLRGRKHECTRRQCRFSRRKLCAQSGKTGAATFAAHDQSWRRGGRISGTTLSDYWLTAYHARR